MKLLGISFGLSCHKNDWDNESIMNGESLRALVFLNCKLSLIIVSSTQGRSEMKWIGI